MRRLNTFFVILCYCLAKVNGNCVQNGKQINCENVVIELLENFENQVK